MRALAPEYVVTISELNHSEPNRDSISLHVPIDGEDLAGNRLGAIGRKKDGKRCYVKHMFPCSLQALFWVRGTRARFMSACPPIAAQ
jgi:hypothetical protein